MKRIIHKNKKFKIGDRVIYRPVHSGNGCLNGEHGTVIYVDTTEAEYTVEFDEQFPDGITDYRTRARGYEPRPFCGWFCKEENLVKER